MSTVEELIESAVDYARRVLVDQPKANLLPTWLIQGKDKTTIVGTPWGADVDKDSAISFIRWMLQKERATGYSFVSEAWMALEDSSHPIGLAPRDRMDRREVVMVTACGRRGQTRMRSWEMIRGPDGTVTELKADPPPSKESQFEGRFFNLFDEP